MVLARSRPTKDKKEIGQWVWLKRDGVWKGPGQVAHSLEGEASVKWRNRYYNCRHAELLPLNAGDLRRHGLTPHELQEGEREECQHGYRRPHDPEEATAGVLEIEGSILSLIQRARQESDQASGNNSSSESSQSDIDESDDTTNL